MSALVSCVCVTHGRAHFLREAVESFVRQDIPGLECEMLIYSDCPEQTLECEVPGVRVVNLDKPVEDLSVKFNMAVEAAAGEYIAWWEDDDISLPFRIKHSLDRTIASGRCYYKQKTAWFYNNGQITSLSENLFFGNSFFRRDSYLKSGGARPGKTDDLTAHTSLMNECGCECELPTPEETFFIYRWGGMGHHNGGLVGTNKEKFDAFRKNTLSDPRFEPGTVKIDPKWEHDYCSMVEAKKASLAGQ